jgi:hypothetical protein
MTAEAIAHTDTVPTAAPASAFAELSGFIDEIQVLMDQTEPSEAITLNFKMRAAFHGVETALTKNDISSGEAERLNFRVRYMRGQMHTRDLHILC